MLEEQKQIDHIVDISCRESGQIFRKMIEPVLNLIDKTGSLEELQEKLQDVGELQKLYQDMECSKLEELVKQGIFFSAMIGRSQE